MILDFQRYCELETLLLTIQQIHLFQYTNILSHLRDLKSPFLTPFDASSRAALFTYYCNYYQYYYCCCCYFHYYYLLLLLNILILILIGLFSITIELVFTIFYHVTLEYDFWHSDFFLLSTCK